MEPIAIYAENVMKLKVAELKLEGRNVIKITGKNGQGKSTLASLFEMLQSTKAIPVDPIRHGESKAIIELLLKTDNGNIRITRTLTPSNKTGSIKIKAEDGSTIGTTEALKNEFLGAISEDILYAYHLPDTAEGRREQIRLFAEALNLKPDKLPDLVGVPVNGSDFEDSFTKANNILDDIQKELNIEIKQAKALAEKYKGAKEIERMDVSNIIKEREEKAQLNQKNQKLLDEVASYEKQVFSQKDVVVGLETELESLEKLVAQKKKQIEVEKDRGFKLKESWLKAKTEAEGATLYDLKPFDEMLVNAEVVNKRCVDYEEKVKAEEILKEKEDELAKLKEKKKNVALYKEKLVKNAHFPIEGITFGEEGVLLNGVPLRQSGKGAGITVGFALQRLRNPKVPIYRIDDGGELDEEHEQLVANLAKEANATVLLVKVGEDKPSIVIDDGEIVEDSYEV